MTIADNIKRLREQHNLTQDQLAEIAGVSDKAVSSWENGNSIPRMGAIQKMADHFGILKSQIIEEGDSDSASLSSNIYKLISKGGYTNEEVATKLGVTSETITNWMYGRSTPNKAQYNNLAKIYGISTMYLITGKEEDKKPIDYKSEIMKKLSSECKVPLYSSFDVRIPLEIQAFEDYIQIPEALYDKHPNSFLLRINDDSISKTAPEGAYALIVPKNGEEINSGDIAVIQINGSESNFKRFYKLQNTIVLEPDSYNPEHLAKTYTKIESEIINVIGKMVWYMAPYNKFN